jgi:protein-L-isoaspartate(D-aspartate) O-methyltransferase
VAPVAQENGQQMLLVLERSEQGFTESVLEAVHFVPLKSGVA